MGLTPENTGLKPYWRPLDLRRQVAFEPQWPSLTVIVRFESRDCLRERARLARGSSADTPVTRGPPSSYSSLLHLVHFISFHIILSYSFISTLLYFALFCRKYTNFTYTLIVEAVDVSVASAPDNTVHFSEIGTGFSEASKRDKRVFIFSFVTQGTGFSETSKRDKRNFIFSFVTQGGKQASSYFLTEEGGGHQTCATTWPFGESLFLEKKKQ